MVSVGGVPSLPLGVLGLGDGLVDGEALGEGEVLGDAAYKERHLIACCIGKLKHFRRVATRYDKYARRFLAFVHFASITIWLK